MRFRLTSSGNPRQRRWWPWRRSVVAVAAAGVLAGALAPGDRVGGAGPGRSTCATNYLVSYLLTGALPPAGTSCPQNASPFGQPAR